MRKKRIETKRKKMEIKPVVADITNTFLGVQGLERRGTHFS